MNKQTYDNYFKEYYSTPKGKKSKRKAQLKYRRKLAEKYGVSQGQAMKIHKEQSDG